MSGVSERAQQAIMAVQQQWLGHELAGDKVGVLALCVDDVVWLRRMNRRCVTRRQWLRGWPYCRRIGFGRSRLQMFTSMAAAGLPTRWRTSLLG